MRGRILPSFTSSRAPKVGGLQKSLPLSPYPATNPQNVRRIACIHVGKGRNLVVNLDGTANQFSEHSTNVVEIFSRLIKDENQLVYYDSGIGTYAPPSFRSLSYIKQVLDHAIDTAIAWNFERIVHAAYKWLSENYQPGDRIFLLGFSRGAYQARVIAGMIETVGLLHKGNERQIPFAYELYSSVMDNNKRHVPDDTATDNATPSAPGKVGEKVSKSEEKRRKQAKLCRQFKKSLCHKDVKVHFVGAWDTVSSIGVLRGKSLPETVSGMGHVCHFRHALALDERRVKFQPEFANGGLGPRDGDIGDVKEVWFAGSHSDIGRGNISNEDLKNFGPALRWMTYEAMALGLRIDPYEGSWKPLELTQSLTTMWRVLEIFPFPSLTYKGANSTSLRPHLCAGRKIQPGQLIHQSVLAKLPTTASSVSASNSIDSHVYVPKATLPESTSQTWETLHKEIDNAAIIEKDPFENASHTLQVLDKISAGTATTASHDQLQSAITTLRSFVDDDTRLASLLEVPDAGMTLMKALHYAFQNFTTNLSCQSKETLVRLLARTWPSSKPLPAHVSPRIPPSKLYKWALGIPNAYQEDPLKVLQPFACLGYLEEGYNWIQSVAFSLQEPGQVIFTSSSVKQTSVLIWDGSTQPPKDVAKDVQGGYSIISHDGSHVAVVDGKDFRIIDTTTTQPPSLIKCTDDEDPNDSGVISSRCFSTDRHTLATGHENGWIKLWRREGDRWNLVKRFKGGNRVYRLDFSRDGSRLAFKVAGGLVRVWVLTDDAVIELEDSRHSLSRTWSPSGDWIVSGTVDGSVKIWSADREEIMHTFNAHDDWIPCLAFRDDEQMLATGSKDHIIRIWRCDTWEKIWEFDIGEWVLSLAFSPNGKRLVSGGINGALHLWDVDTGDDEPAD